MEGRARGRDGEKGQVRGGKEARAERTGRRRERKGTRIQICYLQTCMTSEEASESI